MHRYLDWCVFTYIDLAQQLTRAPCVEQSRKCPLCARAVGPHLVHRIRSRNDFQRYFLPPLPSSPPPNLLPLATTRASGPRRVRTRADRERDRREVDRARARDESNALDRAVDRRKWLYANGLYAKVRKYDNGVVKSCSDIYVARCDKRPHTVSTVSHPFTILRKPGFYQTRNHMGPERATSMA